MEIQCGRKECILKKSNPDGFECQLLSMYGLNDVGELNLSKPHCSLSQGYYKDYYKIIIKVQ